MQELSVIICKHDIQTWHLFHNSTWLREQQWSLEVDSSENLAFAILFVSWQLSHLQ